MAETASRAFVTQAKELAEAGQFAEAIRILQGGLTQYPNFASARVLLGEVYRASGDTAKARVELEQVIKAVPDNFAAHRKLAMVYRELGDRELAVQACEVVLQANPKDQEMLNVLAEVQKERGVPASPDGEEIYSETLAELYIAQGHRDKGLAAYHRLAAQRPGNPRLCARIEALEKEGRRRTQVRRLEEWLAVVRQRRRL